MKYCASYIAVMLLLSCACVCMAESNVEMRHNIALTIDYDDNPFLSFSDPKDDFLGRLFYRYRLGYSPTEAHALTAEYQLGAKKFLEYEDQDTLINLLRAGYSYRGISNTAFGMMLEAKLRNVQDGNEDFFKFIGSGYFQRWFPKGFRIRLTGEFTWFDYRKYNYFDYWHQRYGLKASKNFNGIVTLGIHYNYQNKLFTYNAYSNIGTTSSVILKESNRRRVDNLHEFGVDLQVIKWLIGRLSYSFQVNTSNSYGDSYYNHKIVVALSKSIIDPLSLHVLGIFQFRDALDPVLIPTTLQIEENDEYLNQVTAKLAYRITDWVDIHFKYSRFWNQYTDYDAEFEKNLYSIGAGFQF